MADWLSLNTLRRWPIDATLPPPKLVRRSDSASLDLPMTVLADFGALLGPALGVDPAATPIYLASIARSAGVFTFTFACGEAPAAVHLRSIADPDWSTSIVDTPASSAACGPVFGWRTTLVTGPLAPLASILGDGDLLAAGPAFVLEATAVQSLRDDYVTSISVANESRVMAPPPGQPAPPFTPVDHVQAECLTGVVALAPGFNCAIDQDAAAGTLTVGGSVGGGAGEPCGEVPAYPGESPPAGSPFLSGGAPCRDMILSISGVLGPAVSLTSGGGVSIHADPGDPHGVVVDLTG